MSWLCSFYAWLIGSRAVFSLVDSLFVCLPFFLFLCVCICVFVTLCRSMSLPVCVCVSLCISVVCVSLSLSDHVSLLPVSL